MSTSKMKFRHTPGPWIYDIHEHSFYIFTAAEMDMVADGDPDDVGIARMRGVGRGADDAEQEANARLIAAAPELYDALTKLGNEVSALIGNYEPMLSEMIGNTNAAVLHQRLLEARAALQKGGR